MVDVARVQIYVSFVFSDYSCVEDRSAELSAAKFRLKILLCGMDDGICYVLFQVFLTKFIKSVSIV